MVRAITRVASGIDSFCWARRVSQADQLDAAVRASMSSPPIARPLCIEFYREHLLDFTAAAPARHRQTAGDLRRERLDEQGGPSHGRHRLVQASALGDERREAVVERAVTRDARDRCRHARDLALGDGSVETLHVGEVLKD